MHAPDLIWIEVIQSLCSRKNRHTPEAMLSQTPSTSNSVSTALQITRRAAVIVQPNTAGKNFRQQFETSNSSFVGKQSSTS